MRNTKFYTSILGALLLGACSGFNPSDHVTNAVEAENKEFRTGNRVDFVQFNHKVKFDGGTAAPTTPELDRLNAFVRGIRVGYADEVTVRGSTPERRKAVSRHLSRTGLPIKLREESGNLAELKSNDVLVLVERYVVTPPACPNWTNFHGNEQRNTPGSNYGCAVDSALGYMIANPKDLVTGRAMSPQPSQSIVAAQERYHTDKVKKPANVGTR